MDKLIKSDAACKAQRIELLRYDLKVIEENIQKLMRKNENIETEK